MNSEREVTGRTRVSTVEVQGARGIFRAGVLQLMKPKVESAEVISVRVHQPFQVPDWYEAGDFEDEPVTKRFVR